MDKEGGGGVGRDTPQVLIIPQFQSAADLSSLSLLLTHGLGTAEAPLKDLPPVIEPHDDEDSTPPCRCKDQLDRFQACLARFGILASDVLRILSSLVLLHSLSFAVEPHRIRGRSEATVTSERGEGCHVRVGAPEVLSALGRSLGVEAKVLEAGLLWEVSSLKQVTRKLTSNPPPTTRSSVG